MDERWEAGCEKECRKWGKKSRGFGNRFYYWSLKPGSFDTRRKTDLKMRMEYFILEIAL